MCVFFFYVFFFFLFFCFFFCFNQFRTLVALATYSCHWHIMGKAKIVIYCCLIADILTKFNRNVSWVVLFLMFEFGQNCWIWWVAVATEMLNLLFRTISRMKLKLSKNVHNISFYKNCVFYYYCSCAFIDMASFHRLIMGKVKVGIIFCLIGDIFTKKFYRNVQWVAPMLHMNFVQNSDFDWLPWQIFNLQKVLKNLLLRSHI